MYVLFAYAAWVLLVVVASAPVFGLCVGVLIVREAPRIVSKTVAGIIQGETGAESAALSSTGTALRGPSGSSAKGAG
jgi:pyrimidine deaminase RibD-like protein